MKKYTIAVVGALGNVGMEMCDILEKSELPIGDLVLMDVAKNTGKKVSILINIFNILNILTNLNFFFNWRI